MDKRKTNPDLATYNVGKKLKRRFKQKVIQKHGKGKQQQIVRALFQAFVDDKIPIPVMEVVTATNL